MFAKIFAELQVLIGIQFAKSREDRFIARWVIQHPVGHQLNGPGVITRECFELRGHLVRASVDIPLADQVSVKNPVIERRECLGFFKLALVHGGQSRFAAVSHIVECPNGKRGLEPHVWMKRRRMGGSAHQS